MSYKTPLAAHLFEKQRILRAPYTIQKKYLDEI